LGLENQRHGGKGLKNTGIYGQFRQKILREHHYSQRKLEINRRGHPLDEKEVDSQARRTSTGIGKDKRDKII
jgi:hypothetical protein